MKQQHRGLGYTYYEMSDLENVFSLRHLDNFAKARDYGTGQKYTTLEAHTITLIENNPGITVTGIAKKFNRTKSSVSQLVSRLERKGLVMKTRQDGEDQKIRYLFVTEAGRAFSIAHTAYDEERYHLYVDRLLKYFPSRNSIRPTASSMSS